MLHRIYYIVGIVCCFIHAVVGFPRSSHQIAAVVTGGCRWSAMSGSKACRHYRIDRLHGASTGATENGSAGLGPARVMDNVDNVPVDVKREALILLDCLTSSKDPDDPEYDVEKDMRRDELLLANDYNDLKNDLRFRGLRTSGDKLEMITRLLLHIIDPSIKFDEMSGLGANLKYIDAADLATEKVRIVPIAERNVLDLGPDADDLVALRRRPNLYNSERGVVGGGSRSDNGASTKTAKKDSRLVMDGLARKETSFVALHVTNAATNTPVLKTPPKSSIFAYVVSSKDALQSWTRKHAAIILLPSEIGWRSKSMRVLADEIAFITQSTVIVPDIYRGSYYSSLGDEEISVASREGVKYLLQAHLRDRGSTADSSQADRDYYRPPIEVFDPQSYPDSKCSGSMDEWVQTQRSNNGTIFDDIVSAVRFARTEYDAKSISLAGVGYGGGLALEASCFIHDIARSAQLQEMEDAFYSSNYFKDDVNQDGGDSNDVFASYVEGLMAREESSSREVGYHQSRELKLLRDVLHKYDGVFMKPSAQVLELTEKESISSSSSNSMGLDLDEQSMKSIDDVFQQFSNVDSTVAQASRSQVEAEMKGEEYSADGIIEEDDTESLSEYDDLMKQLEDEASSAIDDDEAWQDEFRQEMRVVSDASVGNSDHYNVVKSEWGVIAKAVKRATDRALLAPYGSLYTSDFLELVPKAVVALCPNRFDADYVADSIHNAVFLVYAKADRTAGARFEDAKRLFDGLSARQQEVLDYCVRVYDGPLGSGGSCIYAPSSEYALKCSQEIISMSALWLDIFSTIEARDYTDGVGETKLDPTTAFATIVPDDLADTTVSPGVVADYLHDDPELFHNFRL